MLSDWELCACANKVIADDHANASDFVAGRIADLTTAGDPRGVATWQAIADRIDRLRDDNAADKVQH